MMCCFRYCTITGNVRHGTQHIHRLCTWNSGNLIHSNRLYLQFLRVFAINQSYVLDLTDKSGKHLYAVNPPHVRLFHDFLRVDGFWELHPHASPDFDESVSTISAPESLYWSSVKFAITPAPCSNRTEWTFFRHCCFYNRRRHCHSTFAGMNFFENSNDHHYSCQLW